MEKCLINAMLWRILRLIFMLMCSPSASCLTAKIQFFSAEHNFWILFPQQNNHMTQYSRIFFLKEVKKFYLVVMKTFPIICLMFDHLIFKSKSVGVFPPLCSVTNLAILIDVLMPKTHLIPEIYWLLDVGISLVMEASRDVYSLFIHSRCIRQRQKLVALVTKW